MASDPTVTITRSWNRTSLNDVGYVVVLSAH